MPSTMHDRFNFFTQVSPYSDPYLSNSEHISPYAVLPTSRAASPYLSPPDLGSSAWAFKSMPTHACPFNVPSCKGCNGTLSDHRSQTGDSTFDALDYQTPSSGPSSICDEDYVPIDRASTPCSSIISFNSPEATRMQLKEEFLRLYFPSGITDRETDFMYTKFLSRDSLQGMGASMNAAVDTLSLIQLGTSHRDERLIGEAHTRYQAAVASLNVDLQDPNAMYDDGVLGAVYLLGFCEVYAPLARGGHPWKTHHRGLRDMLLARGPKGEYSKFAQLLVYNFRHVAAIVGCTERKRVAFAGRAWKQCSAMTDGMMAALSERIIDAPAVFEKADSAMQRPKKDAGELFDVVMELARLERVTQAWLLSWYSSFEGQPYWQQRVEELKSFKKHTRDAPKDVFKKALCFPSFSNASAQVTYWMGLLQMKRTMFELNRLYSKPILPKSEATLVTEANECADRLCESIAWLTQPRFGFCGVVRSLGPLNYATKWYKVTIDLPKMAWTEKVSRSIKAEHFIASLYDTQPFVGWLERPDDLESREETPT